MYAAPPARSFMSSPTAFSIVSTRFARSSSPMGILPRKWSASSIIRPTAEEATMAIDGPGAIDRRRFLAGLIGTAALLGDLRRAAARVAHLSPDAAAVDEAFWFEVQQAFTVGRGII